MRVLLLVSCTLCACVGQVRDERASSGGDDNAATDGSSTDDDNATGDPGDGPGDSDINPGDDDVVTPDVPLGRYILVDQFGYRPNNPKFAVLADPQNGTNAADSYTPAASYELRRADDDVSILTLSPTAWSGGATEASSGDRGWWLDFSSVTTPGDYYLYDGTNVQRSDVFSIDDDVYEPLLKASMRMYFYNRSGIAKPANLTGACWADTATYLGAGQDTEARSVFAKGDGSTARDLRGGWYDAGDTNKYVTFAVRPVHELLSAYTSSPSTWTDDFNIPESGNGVPDILDELRWELDWLMRMQEENGGVLQKIGLDTYNGAAVPLSADTRPRYYLPICSSSTIAAAGMLAHAAYVMASVPGWSDYADDLADSAVAAWNHYQTSAKSDACENGQLTGGDSDWSLAEQDLHAVIAAIYLFAATGDSDYDDYFTEEYTAGGDLHNVLYYLHSVEALLTYADLPDADATTAAAIVTNLQDAVSGNYLEAFPAAPYDDLYRAHMPIWSYHWGSLQVRGRASTINSIAATQGLGNSATALRTRALDHLHYFHGVNPMGMVYLSNMASYGAARSANDIWHMWFRPGTEWDSAGTSSCGPAPGYVPGGPNSQHSASSVAGNPPQKIYGDINDDDVAGWELTEPGIYYQSAYVRALLEAAK